MRIRSSRSAGKAQGAKQDVIVCVDDEEVVLSSLRRQLREACPEHAVKVARSGEDALELLAELRAAGRRVPLLITDQLMPNMTGDELIERVAGQYPQTYQMMLTGQASPASIGRAVNTGRLFRFLSKPWMLEDLSLTVHAALAAHRKDRTVEAQARELEDAYERSLAFVPQEYLKVLERPRLVDIERGDATGVRMSIMFADIRRFTTLVEAMDPQQSFDFVNRYFLRTEGAIQDNGGFVDHYQGDGTMALFPGDAGDALRGAITFSRAVDAFNGERREAGEEEIDIGIGIHCGDVIAGVYGGRDRLQCSVIGDAVNLAARVEGFSSLYETRLVVTESFLDELGSDHGLSLRRLETVRAKGKQKPVTVFEVLDALPEARRERRQSTLADFQAGTVSLVEGDVPAALGSFARVVAADPSDRAARRMLDHAITQLESGAGGSGVTVLTEKAW